MATFAELLKQLESAHKQELQALRSEIAALRLQLQEIQPPEEPLVPSPSIPAKIHAVVSGAARKTASTPLRGERRNPTLTAPYTSTSTSTRDSRGNRWQQRCCGTSTLEIKDLRFQELCDRRYPGRKWDELTSKQRVELIRRALAAKHWLVNPHTLRMKIWDSCVAFALVYCAVVTPYEVVFLSGDSVYLGLFVLDRTVDAMFILDLILHFFLKVEVERPHKGGTFMLSEPRQLRIKYLKSWFFIDFLGCIPYDVISRQITSKPELANRAKILRCVKLLRTMKLLRMLRTSRIVQRWRNDVNLQFTKQRLLCFSVLLLLLSHWMACVWGLFGMAFGAELCDETGRFLDTTEVPLSRVSWVTTLYLGGKVSPDSPCWHLNVYAASLHWAVMTITSIGYGDIVPVRAEEYLVGIICMLMGGVLWAYVIGSVCSIISNRSPVESAFEANCDLLNHTMQEAEVPQRERQIYREFLREAKSYDRRVGFTKVAEKLSPGLRKRLLFHVTRGSLEQVYYFKQAPVEFMMGVASRLQPRFFSRGEALDSLAHCLCMMDRGTVAHNGMLLVPPAVFHEDFIITQHRLQKVCGTVSLTFTQVLILTKHDMEELLEQFPAVKLDVRKKAIRLAFCRALHITARRYHDFLKGNPPGASRMSLSLAFTASFSTGGFGVPQPMAPPRQEGKDWETEVKATSRTGLFLVDGAPPGDGGLPATTRHDQGLEDVLAL